MKTTLKIFGIISNFFDQLYFALCLAALFALIIPMLIEFLGENTEFFDIVQQLIINCL